MEEALNSQNHQSVCRLSLRSPDSFFIANIQVYIPFYVCAQQQQPYNFSNWVILPLRIYDSYLFTKNMQNCPNTKSQRDILYFTANSPSNISSFTPQFREQGRDLTLPPFASFSAIKTINCPEYDLVGVQWALAFTAVHSPTAVFASGYYHKFNLYPIVMEI